MKHVARDEGDACFSFSTSVVSFQVRHTATALWGLSRQRQAKVHGRGKFFENRQLAKLLSGNEVRGKVAIAAMQKAVNFTRSLSTWSRKFLEHHFIPIRRRFNPHDLLLVPTDLLLVQDPFFVGEEGRSFRQETSMAWHGLFLCGLHPLSKAVSIFFFKLMLSRKSSISKTLIQQKTKRSCLRCIARLVCRVPHHRQVS